MDIETELAYLEAAVPPDLLAGPYADTHAHLAANGVRVMPRYVVMHLARNRARGRSLDIAEFIRLVETVPLDVLATSHCAVRRYLAEHGLPPAAKRVRVQVQFWAYREQRRHRARAA